MVLFFYVVFIYIDYILNVIGEKVFLDLVILNYFIKIY